MASTRNNKFYNIALGIRSHGWSRDMEKRYKNKLEKNLKLMSLNLYMPFIILD